MSDLAANFAKVLVIGTYSATDTSVEVESVGRFPDPPFNATWWNATDFADPSDDPRREIVRVLAFTLNSVGGIVHQRLTVTRAQEDTAASAKNLSGKTYKVLAALTAKMWNDLTEAIINSGAGNPGFTTGHGSPEGVVSANPGHRYWDLDTDFEYTKVTGVATDTGWFVH